MISDFVYKHDQCILKCKYRALNRTQMLRVSDCQLLIPTWESYQYPDLIVRVQKRFWQKVKIYML